MDTKVTQANVEIGSITTVIGLLFQGPKGQWEQMVTEWAEDILQRSEEAGIDVEADNYIMFAITMPCGESVSFRTLDDVPRVTVPCPCGEPGRYLVRYSEPCGE